MFLRCPIPLYIGGTGSSLQETIKLPFGKKHKTVLTFYLTFTTIPFFHYYIS